MSHHYSGPDFGFPHGDARLDFTDLYAFPKPGDASKSILIMNVHPSVGVNPQGPTTDVPFATDALYELKIDTNGDAVADIAYRIRFTSDKGGVQTATFRRVEGAEAAGTGDDGQVIVEGVPVSTGMETRVTEAGDYRFFAGWRGDPFFFDTLGALNNLQFTGDDYFADKDVCSIVLEVRNSALGSKKIGLWARTLDGATGKWVQADRGARSNQTPFLAGEQNAAYLAAEPEGDARFVSVFAHALEHTGGYTPVEATRVAGTLLPDVLHYDPTRPGGLPGQWPGTLRRRRRFLPSSPYQWEGDRRQGRAPQRPARLVPLRRAAARGPIGGKGGRLNERLFMSGNKTAIITGASGGIGAGLVEGFLREGYNVVATSRDASQKSTTSGTLVLLDGDIGKQQTASDAVEAAINHFGTVDVLVNNAGIFLTKPFTDFTTEDFEALISINLLGFFYITQRTVKEMLKQNSGCVVSITAALADRPIAGVNGSISMITKGGLNSATKNLAIEYAKDGIRFNAVAPGAVDTQMHRNDPNDSTLQPVMKKATVKDIVDAVLYLAQAGHVSGEILHVDGAAPARRW